MPDANFTIKEFDRAHDECRGADAQRIQLVCAHLGLQINHNDGPTLEETLRDIKVTSYTVQYSRKGQASPENVNVKAYTLFPRVEKIGLLLGLAANSIFVGKPKLTAPPGTHVDHVLRFVFSKKVFNAVFAQAILDMREEHAEALAENTPRKAKWIVLRDHGAICLTVLSYLAASVGKKLAGVWKIIP